MPRPVPSSESTSALHHCFPEGGVCDTAHGRLFTCEVRLRDIYRGGVKLTKSYLSAFRTAASLETDELGRHLQALADADPETTALIDTETCGFHGRPLFLVGMVQYRGGYLTLSQYFARDYAEEAALLARLAEMVPEVRLLVSFNGKAFDWPFVRDRMVYHRLPCPQLNAHVDLLHPSRRRWRAVLPDCKLQTLERYLSGRWRSGDIAGAEIPQRYHDFVRRQDARLIAPIFHHNRMDLITMIELLVALVSRPAETT
jgi:hypothetical protein